MALVLGGFGLGAYFRRLRRRRPELEPSPADELRSKLADALPEWSFIHTHFGFGYRFQPERSHVLNKTATGR